MTAKSVNVWKFLFAIQTVFFAAFVFYACAEKSASEAKDMKINSFDGITIIVKDIAAQKKFYQNVLGLELESDYGDAVFFKIGDRKLGLFAKGHHKEGDESLEGAPKGISHLEFGISVEANEQLTKKLTDAGFHAYRDVFKDADGNLFHFNLDKKVNY
jgi:catechol 2,3-dioxygenase-like lactoylglutathione lyase family enzyme